MAVVAIVACLSAAAVAFFPRAQHRRECPHGMGGSLRRAGDPDRPEERPSREGGKARRDNSPVRSVHRRIVRAAWFRNERLRRVGWRMRVGGPFDRLDSASRSSSVLRQGCESRSIVAHTQGREPIAEGGTPGPETISDTPAGTETRLRNAELLSGDSNYGRL